MLEFAFAFCVCVLRSRVAFACRVHLLHLHFAFAWCICIPHLHVAFAFRICILHLLGVQVCDRRPLSRCAFACCTYALRLCATRSGTSMYMHCAQAPHVVLVSCTTLQLLKRRIRFSCAQSATSLLDLLLYSMKTTSHTLDSTGSSLFLFAKKRKSSGAVRLDERRVRQKRRKSGVEKAKGAD